MHLRRCKEQGQESRQHAAQCGQGSAKREWVRGTLCPGMVGGNERLSVKLEAGEPWLEVHQGQWRVGMVQVPTGDKHAAAGLHAVQHAAGI